MTAQKFLRTINSYKILISQRKFEAEKNDNEIYSDGKNEEGEMTSNDFPDLIKTSSDAIYEQKEEEWYKLVGKENFLSLDEKSRNFLIKTAGILDFDSKINIKKAYRYFIYNDK